MNRKHYQEDEEATHQVSIGNKALLALFFALASVCGMFFAFGYTFGRHAVPANFSLGRVPTAAAPLSPSASAAQPPNSSDLSAVENNQTPQGLQSANGSTADSSANGVPPPAASATGAPPATGAAVAPAGAVPAEASFAVQVFAGTKIDASTLAAALKERQYPVTVVPPSYAGDDIYRVQVGPYKTREEAAGVKTRLNADGYAADIISQ